MSFKLKSLTNNIARPTWIYETTDTPDMIGDGYFNKAWMNVEKGEKIDVLSDFNGDHPSVGVFYVIFVEGDNVIVRQYGDWLDLSMEVATDEPSDTDTKIINAIKRLDRNNTGNWTISGLPDRRALQAELGASVDPDTLERLWTQLQAELEEVA